MEKVISSLWLQFDSRSMSFKVSGGDMEFIGKWFAMNKINVKNNNKGSWETQIFMCFGITPTSMGQLKCKYTI